MHFDFWQRWGIELDDASFARAWAALGAAQVSEGRLSTAGLNEVKGSLPYLHWTFPTKEIPVEGAPKEWANAWGALPALFAIFGADPPRLRVIGAPRDEPILPWYRMLSEAQPEPASVSIAIDAPRAQLQIELPLRFGSIDERARKVVDDARFFWPSSDLTRSVPLDRDATHCDILVYTGRARSLLQELLRAPFRIKANLVVLFGGDDGDWGELEALLASVLAETRASGFLLIGRKLPDDDLARFLNDVVFDFSHAKGIDEAIQIAAEKTKGMNAGDVIGGFTHDLAAFRVPELVERINARIDALPEGVEVAMAEAGGVEMAAPPAAARMNPEELDFEHESDGSSRIARSSTATAGATAPPQVLGARAARFLQQRSFVGEKGELREASEGFLQNTPALIRVRIAAPDETWDALPTAFPVEKLPQHLESWTLTIWLTEPDHLPNGIRRTIELPRDGDSTECEFPFRPKKHPRFEGRITVLHRGRIIQTAVLRASVRPAGVPGDVVAPKLHDEVAVRHRLGNLDERRRYDLAFVANHDSWGRPLLTSLSPNAAWVRNLDDMPLIAGEINKTLSPVAKSVQDYADGLRGEKGRALLVQLAQHGRVLYEFLQESLGDPSNDPTSAAEEYVQIVTMSSSSVVPLEFAYEFTAPEDDAAVCGKWLKAAAKKKWLKKCEDDESGRTVCPLGFWGLTKVIERHAPAPGLDADEKELYLQSEPTRETQTLRLGGVAVLGSSKRVPKANLDALKTIVAKHCGAEPQVATSWDDWETLVKGTRPNLLLALPHTGGSKTNVTVEIGDGKSIKTITLRKTHVYPPPIGGRQPPVLALIGCDTAGTADEYGSHVRFLRARGAGIVIGTIATVFGEHAATVAGKLVEGMLPEDPKKSIRLGELIREIRRESLIDGLLMPLCLVAYGDADWIVSRKGAGDD